MKKNNIIRKALIYSLIGATVAGNVVPAYAYTNSVGNVDETGTVTAPTDAESCEVYATLASSFKVTIPKKITLDGGTKKGAYTVDVEGDIGGTDVIKVVPDASVALHSTNLTDVTASISQDKTEWSYDQILADSKVAGNGLIDASGITAGAWNGTFNFNINLKEVVNISSGKAGIYDENGIQTYSWQELLDNGYLYVSDTGVLTNAEGTSVREKNHNTDIFDGTLIIDNSVTEIGNYTFYCQENLTGVVIPDSVTMIGVEAFYCCDLNNDDKPLATIYFEGGLSDIVSKDAFYGNKIVDIYYAGTEEEFDNISVYSHSWSYDNDGNLVCNYKSTPSGKLKSSFDASDEITFHYSTSFYNEIIQEP